MSYEHLLFAVSDGPRAAAARSACRASSDKAGHSSCRSTRVSFSKRTDMREGMAALLERREAEFTGT
ncbi:MAG: hypothetical protein IH965_09520 [Gemmatimonadetes bacterium]|nr:hypothetical protein [Gemmatimonadota bacterium]